MKAWVRALAIGMLLEGLLLAQPGSALATPSGGEDSTERSAATTAPSDAPKEEAKRPSIPPLPPEYLVQEEGGIRLAYHPSARERVRPLIGQAGAIRTQLSEELGVGVLSSFEVRIAASVPGEMERLSPSKSAVSNVASTFGELRLIVMSLSSPLAMEPPSLADVLRHELALLALDQALGAASPASRTSPTSRIAPTPPLHRVPRWFLQGYAVHVAGDHAALRAQSLCMAALQGSLLSLADLDASLPASTPQASIAYAQAADFLRFLTQEGSKARFAALIASLRAGEAFERSIAAAYASEPAEIELSWRKDMAKRYSFLPVIFAGTVVWSFAFAFALVRRARRLRSLGSPEERRPTLVRRARIAEPEARGRLALVSAGRSIAASRARMDRVKSDGLMLGEAMPPEAEIPKVEHEGQWHTLH